MPTTSFDDYIREVEARATPAERTLLDAARERAKAVLKQVEYKIEKRERIDAYVARMATEYGAENIIQHAKGTIRSTATARASRSSWVT